MRLRSLVGALALSAAVPLLAPTQAEAAHRHSRSCGHRSYDSYRSYDRGYYNDGYRYRGGSRRYRGYDYGYRPYARSRYYYSPAPRYYYRRPYRRPHFSIHLDF